jgi:type IV secretory pathway component VirB8
MNPYTSTLRPRRINRNRRRLLLILSLAGILAYYAISSIAYPLPL